MSHEITLEQALERAHQAECVARLLASTSLNMVACEVEAVANLIAHLAGSAATWLSDELAQREGSA